MLQKYSKDCPEIHWYVYTRSCIYKTIKITSSVMEWCLYVCILISNVFSYIIFLQYVFLLHSKRRFLKLLSHRFQASNDILFQRQNWICIRKKEERFFRLTLLWCSHLCLILSQTWSDMLDDKVNDKHVEKTEVFLKIGVPEKCQIFEKSLSMFFIFQKSYRLKYFSRVFLSL